MAELLPARRRRGARRRVESSCRAIHWGRFELVGERLFDLSTEGGLLACDAEVRVGDEVLLAFQMPWLGPHVLVVAEVTRVVEGYRERDRGYCAGLRFLDLDAGDRVELASRLAWLESTGAERPHPVDYARTVQTIDHVAGPDAGILIAELEAV